jgi:putative transposase
MARKTSRVRRTFTPQFKKDAVALVLGGRTVNQVAHDLGIARSLLQRWKAALPLDRHRPGGAARRARSPAARLHRSGPQSALGRGHHLRPHGPGLAAPRHRARPLRSAHRGLGHGADPRPAPRGRRARHGAGRPTPPGLLVHSDRGGPYLATRVQQQLAAHRAIASTSRPGRCLDNAVAESFFHTLKTELVYQHRYRTREEARLAIFVYIAAFYNRIRRHSSNGYRSPDDHEAHYVVSRT